MEDVTAASEECVRVIAVECATVVVEEEAVRQIIEEVKVEELVTVEVSSVEREEKMVILTGGRLCRRRVLIGKAVEERKVLQETGNLMELELRSSRRSWTVTPKIQQKKNGKINLK